MANRPVASERYERRRRIPREIRERSRRERDERDEADRFERALAKRKWIYRHDLYAKVCEPIPYWYRSQLFQLPFFQIYLRQI